MAPRVFIVPGFATVGALIAARRASRVGWLFLGLGLVAALQAWTMVYAERDALVDPASLPAASAVQLLSGWLWPLNYLLFCVILLLFPDGHLPSPRWRPAARFILAAQGLSTLLNAPVPGEGNPLSVPALQEPAGQQLALAVNAAALVGLVISAAAPFLRFRRAGYQQRQQLKWIAFTVAVSVLTTLAGIALDQLFPGAVIVRLIGWLGFFGVVVGLPVAVAVAHPAPPPVRHRPTDQPHRRLRAAHRQLGTGLRRGRAHPWPGVRRRDRGPAQLGGCRRHPRSGRAVPAGPPTHPSSR